MALRRSLLLIAIAIIAVFVVLVAFSINQDFLVRFVYPPYNLNEDSNLTVKGTVTSIEEDYMSRGMVYSNYHIFRYFINLNITEVVWTSEDWLNALIVGDTAFRENSISVGYDYPDSPNVAVGQQVECSGFFLGATDLCYSFILAVSPDISKSFLTPDVILE